MVLSQIISRTKLCSAFSAALCIFGGLLMTAAPGSGHAQDLKIGLMPAVDSIPLLVAQDQSYFEEEGIEVELQIFRDQLYRETALQTNQIDGSISDLINAVYNWRSGSGIKVGSLTDGHFALVTAPGSEIGSIQAWNRAESVQVGLLENSIIYYVAERILEESGGDPERIDLFQTLQVPARMEMVVQGRIEAALLPEPVSQIAINRGAKLLVDSSVLDQTPGVLLFTAAAQREKQREIAALYRAYNRAVARLNQDADSLRPAIIRLGEFPPSVEESMVIPRYQPARRPTPGELDDVTLWMASKGLVEQRPGYGAVVAEGLLP